MIEPIKPIIFTDGIAELAAVLHEQGIGCNYRAVPHRRFHHENGPDGTALVSVVYDEPEPTGYDVDGWKHDGDHEVVARAIRALWGAE